MRLFIASTFNTHGRSVDILLQSPVDPFSIKRDLSASMHPKRIVCSILRSSQMFKKIQHQHAASICLLWSVNQIFIASKVWKQSLDVFYKKDVLRNFAKATEKQLCQTLFFNKFAGFSLISIWSFHHGCRYRHKMIPFIFWHCWFC